MLTASDDVERLSAPLAGLGARLELGPHGPEAAFAQAPANDAVLAAGGVALLPDLGVLGVDGADSAPFLQGQFTNDVAGLAPDSAALNGYCSPKGRLLVGMLVARLPERFTIITDGALLASLRRRLAMFVLRAKVRLQDERAGAVVVGLTGAAAPAALAGLSLDMPSPMRVGRGADGLVTVGLTPVRLGGAEVARVLLIVPAGRIGVTWSTLSESLAPIGTADWRRLDILSGVARIFPATVDAFVPQMLNYELVGGVSFKKGCYPGQEIVARTQYLGRLKQRMFLAHADACCAPGDPVNGPEGGDPLGSVVMSAPAPAGGWLVLCAIRHGGRVPDAASGLTIGGQAIHPGALPYPVPVG